MIITIDGPASSGKGTLAKALAKKIGFVYLDTGAMYRAVTFYCLQRNIDVFDEAAVVAAIKDVEISFDKKRDIYLNGENVTVEIRTDDISSLTSNPVSTYQGVRDGIVELERTYAKNTNIIIDGRDSGTVVFPDADIKLFISASLKERAMRRYKQNIDLGLETTYNAVLMDLAFRDKNDILRAISPLRIPKNSIIIDTTALDLESAFNHVYDVVKDKIPTHTK